MSLEHAPQRAKQAPSPWAQQQVSRLPPDTPRILRLPETCYITGLTNQQIWRRDGVFVADEKTGILGSIGRRKAETVFLELLGKFEADNRHVSESRNATNYAPRIFAERTEREGFNKADFRRAMEALFSQGQIKIEEYGRKSDLRRRIAVV